tara:strand:+ start:141 stop:536 length:396 start_codon:yes stop_codon:yes gene_type:complete
MLAVAEKLIHFFLSLLLIFIGIKLRSDPIFEQLCSGMAINPLRVGDMIPEVDAPVVGSMFGAGYCVRNTPNFFLLAGILLLVASSMGLANSLGLVKERFKVTQPEQKPINNKFEEIREKYKRRLRERYRRR